MPFLLCLSRPRFLLFLVCREIDKGVCVLTCAGVQVERPREWVQETSSPGYESTDNYQGHERWGEFSGHFHYTVRDIMANVIL